MQHRRKNVFLKLWLSYLLILAVPVVISAYLYKNMEDVLVDNANRSNMAMLEQVKGVVENHLKEIDHLSIQVATHPKLQALWNINDSHRYLEFNEAVKILKNFHLGSSFISHFFIHLQGQDIILSPELKTDTTMYLTKLASYQNASEEDIRRSVLSGYHFRTFWPSAAVVTESVTEYMITSAVTLPLGEKDNVRATLVMQINEQQIFDLLKQVNWANNASMFIMDGTGQTILSISEDGMQLDPSALEDKNSSGYYSTARYNGENMLISHTGGDSGWTYVSLAPEEQVLSRVNEMKRWAIKLLIIAILAGTLIAYAMAYRSYIPIRDMVLSLLKGEPQQPHTAKTMNEYEFIKSSIERNRAEGEQLRHALAGHVPVVRAHYLTRLLKGQVPSGSFDGQSLGFIDLKFQSDHLCVALIEVDDCSRFIARNSEEESALVRFVLANLSQELLQERGYVIETEQNQLALLLVLPDASDASKQERNELIRQLKEMTHTRFRMDVTIAFSSVRTGMEEAARCYSEALSALDYRIVHGIGQIIDYESIKDMERHFYYYPLEIESQLMNLLKSGDYPGAEKLLNDIYWQNIESGSLTPEMGKCLFFDLLSTVLKVMNALKIDTAGQFPGSGDPAKELLNSTSAVEMQAKLKQLCRFLCGRVQEARSQQGDRLNNQVLAFIQERFRDNSLSLTMIADHFGMTPQYISGYFKKHNHLNLTDYIVENRIGEAKRLLGDTDFTIVQIAKKVGYATDIGFIRVFKKLEGVTPGKYRETTHQLRQLEA
ncbi:helix-turn-helix domain-containing protein [Cohnella sp.]|uniref:helix-turn-helix domain-containing protein n=1 Tax=Cohnella sp. TaxID=1883426 RepID=UPI00356394FE